MQHPVFVVGIYLPISLADTAVKRFGYGFYAVLAIQIGLEFQINLFLFLILNSKILLSLVLAVAFVATAKTKDIKLYISKAPVSPSGPEEFPVSAATDIFTNETILPSLVSQ